MSISQKFFPLSYFLFSICKVTKWLFFVFSLSLVDGLYSDRWSYYSVVFPSPLSLNCSPSPPQEIQLVSSLLIPSSCPLFCQQVVFLLPVSSNGCPHSSITKRLSSLLFHQMVVLLYLQVVILCPLLPNGCPLSSTTCTKWLSSLLYHQMVVLSPLSPNGCPPLSSSGYPLSSITRWLSSLLYHQVVVLSPFSPNGCPPLGCPLFSITNWLSFLSPGGCSLSSITKWLSK